ncbi:uncharacterized protein LOC141665082 [Apium graveolens]|uniref:uncharacterized protein LOC141665082 n=1 Tax=Apium graveolens TaxID=4045 RepID=UPI003D78B8AC
MVQIGRNMEKDLKEKVIAVIQQYHDVFACGAEEMPGLDPKKAKHYLNVQPEAKPIILRFGIPKIYVYDNETQFIGNKLRRFLHHFGVQQKFSSVANPQENGAIEAANKIIIQRITKRMGKANGRWVEELPWVLWAYRTTLMSFTGETPFRLAYGTEASVPVEVGLESYRTEVYNMETNNFGLRANVDL